MRLPHQTRHRIERKPAQRASLCLYGVSDTAETQWVRLVLAEKHLEHARFEAVHPSRPPEDLVALNPALRLPTLVDRDAVVVSAPIIASYLDERFPPPPLMPPEPAQRARVRLLLDLLTGTVFPALDQDETATLEPLLRDLTDLVAPRQRLLGLDYHLADCAAAVWLSRLPPHPAGMTTEGQTRLSAYRRRLLARPAVESVLT